MNADDSAIRCRIARSNCLCMTPKVFLRSVGVTRDIFQKICETLDSDSKAILFTVSSCPNSNMAHRVSMVTDVEEACAPILSRARVKLHPQPTDDPLDPLNWTSFRKHSILIIVMWMYVKPADFRNQTSKLR